MSPQPEHYRQRLVSRLSRTVPFASGTLVYVLNWNLDVQVTRRDGTIVVTPRGEVDLLTVSRLEDALRTATRVPRMPVIVDLTRTNFLACCGIGALAVGRATLAATGRALVVTGAQGQVRRLLQLCGEPAADAVPVGRAS